MESACEGEVHEESAVKGDKGMQTEKNDKKGDRSDQRMSLNRTQYRSC